MLKVEFPNLFEFILNDIGGLPTPRKRKIKYNVNY